MKKLITAVFILMLPTVALASVEEDQQLQLQRQFERDQFRQKELLQIKKEQEEIEEEERRLAREKELDRPEIKPDDHCFVIQEIVFSPNKLISKFRQKILTKNYLGKCLNISQISELNQKISSYLIDQGYATSKSTILPQSLEGGVLQIEITESRLEKIIFNQESLSDKVQKFTAFGVLENEEILNLKKIDQGLEQINRLSSNNAVTKIIPGAKENSSIILVENHPQDTSRVNLSYDNNGSTNTGERRLTTSFSQDNIFKLNDNFNVSRTSNETEAIRDKKGSESLSVGFSVPFTWYNLTLSYSNSSYFFHTPVSGSKQHGVTSTKSAAFDVTLLKRKKFRLVSNFKFSQRYNRSFTDYAKEDIQSRKTSIASFGLSATTFFKNSSLFLNPSFSKTVPVLNSKKDSNFLPSAAIHAEFEMFELYGNYSHRFLTAQTPINYSLTFDSQISQQTLYGNDNFAVGGIYSVRGFRNGSIANDSGYSVKNEFNVNLGKAILPYLNQEKIPQFLRHLNNFYIAPFYDYGYVRSKGGRDSGRLSGAGFRVGCNYQNIGASLTIANVISKSQYLLSNRHENKAIFFNLASGFGF